jgi:ubiquinone/menaquinone biosynthesis C-methylase UbiE
VRARLSARSTQQIPAALDAGWGASRSAVAGKSLAELRAMGDSYVVAENTALPFANASIDRVLTNSVPIDVNTFIGPGVQSSEIWRILKPGGDWLHNGEVMPWP